MNRGPVHGGGSNFKTFWQLTVLLAFIAGGAAIFIPFGAKVFDWHLQQRSFTLKLRVARITGVERYTQLVMMGETIGDVRRIEHKPDQHGVIDAVLTLNINPEKAKYLTNQTLFYITHRNFIGLTIIEAVPRPGGKLLPSGSEVRGYPPFDFGAMGKKIDQMAASIGRYQKIVDPEMVNHIKEIAQRGGDLGNQLLRYLPRYKRSLKKQLGTLQNLKKKLTLTPVELAILQKMKKQLPGIIHTTKKGLKLIDQGVDLAEKGMEIRDDLLITYHKSMTKIDKMIATTKGLIQRIDRIIPVVDGMMSWLETGLGSVGMLLNDPTIYNNSQLIFKMMKQQLYRYLIPAVDQSDGFKNHLR